MTNPTMRDPPTVSLQIRSVKTSGPPGYSFSVVQTTHHSRPEPNVHRKRCTKVYHLPFLHPPWERGGCRRGVFPRRKCWVNGREFSGWRIIVGTTLNPKVECLRPSVLGYQVLFGHQPPKLRLSEDSEQETPSAPT